MHDFLSVHVERVNVAWADRTTRGNMIAAAKSHVDNLEVTLKKQLDCLAALRAALSDPQGSLAEVSVCSFGSH